MAADQGAPQGAGRRRGGCAGRAVRVAVVLLAAIGLLATGEFFFGAPGVGHFRSPEGRAEYLAQYDTAMEGLPEPTGDHDVPTGCGTVRAYEWSSPETEGTVPVVLIPGISSGVPMWVENLAGFADGRRVIAFDAIGDAGLSTQALPITSFEDQAEWIAEALALLAPEGAHVAGHSFGGAGAAAYALAHPADVASLTLLEPFMTVANPPAGKFAWAMVGSLPLIPESLRNRALSEIGGAPYDPDDPMARMIAAGTEHYHSSLPTPSVLDDAELRALTMPVYAAFGDTDSLAGGQEGADRAEELLPDAEVTMWAGATHSLPMQEAEALDGELDAFWSRAEG